MGFWDICWWIVKGLLVIWVLLVMMTLIVSMIKTLAEKIDPPKKKRAVKYNEPPEFHRTACALMLHEGNGHITYVDDEKVLHIENVYIDGERPDILTVKIMKMDKGVVEDESASERSERAV